jgi:hypothetical protein
MPNCPSVRLQGAQAKRRSSQALVALIRVENKKTGWIANRIIKVFDRFI